MNVGKTRLLQVMVVFAIVLFSACTPQSQGGLLSAVSDSNSMVSYSAALPILQTAVPEPNQGRIVLKNANLQIVVQNVVTVMDSISKMAEDMGGWVINSSTAKSSRADSNDAVVGSIAIRVPAGQFTVAITRIKDQSTSVASEDITGTDVTQEYTDLNSQLTNLQAAERQLQTILDSATTTDDVLKIYNELVRVRGEIETTQGRINYYKEASNFSSISISLSPPSVAQASVQVDTGWNPGTTVTGAFNALINILQAIANLLIIIIVLVLPLALLIGIPIWVINKLLHRYGWIKNRPSAIKVPHTPSDTEVENDIG